METFYQHTQAFIGYLEHVKSASPHTVRNYALDLRIFLQFAKEQVDSMDQIDKQLIRRFLAKMQRQNLAKPTVLRRLSTLRSFYNYLIKRRLIEVNPMEGIERFKAHKSLPRALTYAQVERLLEQPDTTTLLGLRNKAMMELFYSSGLRVGELVAMNRSDINWHALLMKIRGKGKKERIIPLTANSAKWLQTYLDHSKRQAKQDDQETLFLNKLGTRISTRSVDRLFRLYLIKSGLSGKITPHTIRHTIATHWLEQGMDLKVIQTLLGHSSLSTTTIYTKVTPALKKEAYDRAHPRS